MISFTRACQIRHTHMGLGFRYLYAFSFDNVTHCNSTRAYIEMQIALLRSLDRLECTSHAENVAQKSEQNALIYNNLATGGIPCWYLELVYSNHPAIAQSKVFSDPIAFPPHTRPPFWVADTILPSIPVEQTDFDGDRGQKMVH